MTEVFTESDGTCETRIPGLRVMVEGRFSLQGWTIYIEARRRGVSVTLMDAKDLSSPTHQLFATWERIESMIGPGMTDIESRAIDDAARYMASRGLGCCVLGD